MYLLEPGFSLGSGPDFLILEAARQPRLVPKPERMTSDGGKSTGGREGPWGFKFDTLRGNEHFRLT